MLLFYFVLLFWCLGVVVLRKPWKNPQVGDFFGSVKDILCKFLHTVIQLYTLLPKHVEVRKKTVFFLHRMVECLPGAVFFSKLNYSSSAWYIFACLPLGELERFLPVALRALVASADEQNIVTIFQLLNQLLTKPKVHFFASVFTKRSEFSCWI